MRLALQARLWQISKILPGDLAGHLEQHAVLPVLYASSWLLTAFSADFPLFWSSRVLDVIFTDCYIEPMMKVKNIRTSHFYPQTLLLNIASGVALYPFHE